MMAAVWNNHRLSSVSDIVKANNLYPVALVLAAKTWQSETSSDNRNLDEMGDFSTFEPIFALSSDARSRVATMLLCPTK